MTEITPKKAMTPKEYAMTSEYKERAYSYKFRRCVDDLMQSPIVLMGSTFQSSTKLAKKLDKEFGSIKRLILKNLWQFSSVKGKVELGVYYPDGVEAESVWLKVGKLKLAIWIKDKADLRKCSNDFILQAFLDEWNSA